MTDPVSKVEIEDVLSSIRRLVSEETRKSQGSTSANAPASRDKLVLTQALRVTEAESDTDGKPADTADTAARTDEARTGEGLAPHTGRANAFPDDGLPDDGLPDDGLPDDAFPDDGVSGGASARGAEVEDTAKSTSQRPEAASGTAPARPAHDISGPEAPMATMVEPVPAGTDPGRWTSRPDPADSPRTGAPAAQSTDKPPFGARKSGSPDGSAAADDTAPFPLSAYRRPETAAQTPSNTADAPADDPGTAPRDTPAASSANGVLRSVPTEAPVAAAPTEPAEAEIAADADLERLAASRDQFTWSRASRRASTARSGFTDGAVVEPPLSAPLDALAETGSQEPEEGAATAHSAPAQTDTPDDSETLRHGPEIADELEDELEDGHKDGHEDRPKDGYGDQADDTAEGTADTGHAPRADTPEDALDATLEQAIQQAAASGSDPMPAGPDLPQAAPLRMQGEPLAPDADVPIPANAAAAIEALTAKIAQLEAQLAESRAGTAAITPAADASQDRASASASSALAPAADGSGENLDEDEPADYATAAEIRRHWHPDPDAGMPDADPDHHSEDGPEDDIIDAEAEVAAALREAQDSNAGVFDTEEAILDEDTLRELVTDIVREELQGALGERITRNVRKLVRREIHRAFAAQDLD